MDSRNVPFHIQVGNSSASAKRSLAERENGEIVQNKRKVQVQVEVPRLAKEHKKFLDLNYRFYSKLTFDPELVKSVDNSSANKPIWVEIRKTGHVFDPRRKDDYLCELSKEVKLKRALLEIDENWIGPMPSRKLFVTNLPSNSTPSSLTFIFESYGDIEEIDILRDPSTGKYMQTAKVVFYSWESSFSAMKGLCHSNLRADFKLDLFYDEKEILFNQAKLELSKPKVIVELPSKIIKETASPKLVVPSAKPSISVLSKPSDNTVFVTIDCKYLPSYADASEVENLFRNFGLKRVFKEESKWLIQLTSKECAKRSLICLNGKVFNGRKLFVEEMKSPSWEYRETDKDQICKFIIEKLADSVLDSIRQRTIRTLLREKLKEHFLLKASVAPSATIIKQNILDSSVGESKSNSFALPNFKKRNASDLTTSSAAVSRSESKESVVLEEEEKNSTDIIESKPLKKKKITKKKPLEESPPIETNQVLFESGCARTEGKFDIKKEKTIVRIDTHEKSKRNNNGRDQRAAYRRLAVDLSSVNSDMMKYNVFQLRKKQLKVQKSYIHGWGLFCLEDIEPHDIVTEYLGEMIRIAVAEKREKDYERRGIGSSYLFRLDEEYVIDSTKMGNVARFVNHSCMPNCTAKVITVSGGHKKIVFYAKRHIYQGEELTYDYKFPKEDEKLPCLCGIPECKGFLN